MNSSIHRILPILILVLTAGAVLFMNAETAATGPLYASNGLGIMLPDTYGSGRGMGGTGIADLNGSNLIRGNPALLSGFTVHTYSFGATHERNRAFTGGAESPSFAKTRAEVFRLVIPLAKGIVLGWGLSPMSRTDSIIKYRSSDFTDTVEFTGGLNVSSVSLAGTIRDIVRVGISLDYTFGMIEEKWSRSFKDDDLYDSEDSIKQKFKGYGVTLGAITRVWKNTNVGIGYSPRTNVDMSVRTVPGAFGNPETTHSTTEIRLPERVRLGVSTIVRTRLVANADFTLARWENAAKTSTEKKMYTDTMTFGAGVRLIPESSMGASFYEKMPISAGFRFGNMYYKSYPKVDTVDEKAFTLGIEFPLKENAASLIGTFELGVRGDKSKNGWEENFTNFGIVLIGTIK